MTAQELIALLQQYEPYTEVRLATQPKRPLEFELENVVDAEIDDGEMDEPYTVIYLVEGEQIGYLPLVVTEAAGWSR